MKGAGVNPMAQVFRICSLSTLFFFMSLRSTHADDNDHYSIYIKEASRYRDDLIFLAVTSLSFAFLIAFIGSIFGYMAFLDQRIMTRYSSEAATVEATVVSTEVAPSGTVHRDSCCGSGHKEYSVLVEYEQMGASDDHRIRVRKQAGAIEGDFFRPSHCKQNVKADQVPIGRFRTLDSMADQSNDAEDLEAVKGVLKAKIIFNQDSFFQTFLIEERKLQMLVIEGKPKSGFPLQEHKRRMNLQYRLPSIFFLVVGLLITIFCIHTGARILFELVESGDLQRTIAMALTVGFSVAILLQIPCIHLTMNPAFQKMLEEEYFENSGLMQTVPDDSTLSSRSDAYLLHP